MSSPLSNNSKKGSKSEGNSPTHSPLNLDNFDLKGANKRYVNTGNDENDYKVEDVQNRNDQEDYKIEHVPGCIGCKCEIHEECAFIIDRDGYNWHPECFRCTKCDKQIEDGQYKPGKDGRPVCLPCGLPQCAGCMNLIVGDLLVARHVDDTPYAFHTQCLKCVHCNVNISDKYKATEHGFICDACDSPQCMTCFKRIPGGDQYYLDNDTHAPQCNNCFRTKALAKTTMNTYSTYTTPNQNHTVTREGNTTRIVLQPQTSVYNGNGGYVMAPTPTAGTPLRRTPVHTVYAN